jgi:phospholipid-binding lipoprotein MlaA
MTLTQPLRWIRAGALALALLAGGCATTGAARNPEDPIEPWNRAMYAIHEPIQEGLIIPAIEAYVKYVPFVIRQPISNVFNNIDDLFSALNGFLQGKPDKAGHDLGRVIMNTLWGLGGLIDFASEAGIPRGNEDFGQTFGVWGFPQGPYLFVPLWGPTTVRDGTGSLVRLYVGPVGYIPDVPTRNILYAIGAVDLEAQALDAQKLVDQAALDKYTFIRRAYLQRRNSLTHDGKPPPEKDD